MPKSNIFRINQQNSAADNFPTAIDFFTTYCRSRNLSPNTINYYGYCLLSLTRFLEKHCPQATPKDMDTQLIRKFLLEQTRTNSASTACHCHTTLCVFFGYLVSDGFLSASPMDGIEKPKRRKSIIQTFTMPHIESLIKTCGNNFSGIRDRSMILIMLDCGLRVSELVGITLDDISWSEQTFRVIGKGDKERIVPFGKTVHNALNKYVSRRGKLSTSRLFVNCYGEPLSRYAVRELISRKGDDIAISGVRCSPHTFRHTFAVQYLRNGGDVFSLQKLLGHTDLSMTRKYAELSQTDVQEKHRMYSPADRFEMMESDRTRMR